MELDGNEEDDEIGWVVCEPVWVVLVEGDGFELDRRKVVPGVNAVAVWRVEREAARRLSVVKRRRPEL